ncbi:scavenger receptor class B member 1-like [Drosophila eugracilis]|uniref:scavenger receptor class B member 1-like n=1 Tax=Drosophila eugracilis TaxID=29029 RepID=UPI001BDA57E6|nr:scavenger receptor class B member 1-like [Drosophila eugracilis]
MTEGGEIFNLWAQPPVDLYIKIYIFNISNAQEFLAGRERLRVEQVGPYVYKEIMTHENVTFNQNNTMSSTPSHPLVWQEQMSQGCHENDEVVMLNIAMLSLPAMHEIPARRCVSSFAGGGHRTIGHCRHLVNLDNYFPLGIKAAPCRP